MITMIEPRFKPTDDDVEAAIRRFDRTADHLVKRVESGTVAYLAFAGKHRDDEVKYGTCWGINPEPIGNATGPYGPFHNQYWQANFRLTAPCVVTDAHGLHWICQE